MPPPDLASLEAEALAHLASAGQTVVSAEVVSLALAARCHEEVRVWAEDFARAHGLAVEEEADGTGFRLRVL